MSQRKHRGSDFRDFLKDEGILGEVEARAMKQAMSLQISRLLKESSLTKAEMAARMKTNCHRCHSFLWLKCGYRKTPE